MSTVDPPPFRQVKTKTVYGAALISVVQVLQRVGDSKTVSYKIFAPEGVAVELVPAGATSGQKLR